MAPSTFASAAASSGQNNAPPRDGGSEWCVVATHVCPGKLLPAAVRRWPLAQTQPREDHVANECLRRSRRPNGATQTFRRTSNVNAMSAPNPHTENSAAAIPSQPARYVPPHRNGTIADARYSKGQLLDLFQRQQSTHGGLSDDLNSLFVGGWQPDGANGNATGSWGRGDHNRDPPPGPEVCWDRDGRVEPLGLTDLDDEEKEVRTAIRDEMRSDLWWRLTDLNSSSCLRSIRRSSLRRRTRRTRRPTACPAGRSQSPTASILLADSGFPRPALRARKAAVGRLASPIHSPTL